ncbi:hypothetical protein TWF694_001915 [Orbilia ellipsospora]|uniref:Uncharacterized protein n=1 Tax=Orbilia ellipsospora TaxID=2528407 RepID=A0AAV9X433_9PEZI
MLINSTTLALLVLLHFLPLVKPQVATLRSTTGDTTALATYLNGGPLTEFSLPQACNTVLSSDVETFTLPENLRAGSGVDILVYSKFLVGCYASGPSSCCPPNWKESYFYETVSSTGARGSCPVGYTTLPATTLVDYIPPGSLRNTEIVYLYSANQTAKPCCPTFIYSRSTIATYTAELILSFESSPNTLPHTNSYASCIYRQPDIDTSYTSSGTTVSVDNLFWAHALYVFTSTETQATTSNISSTESNAQTIGTVSPTSTLAEPGVAASSGVLSSTGLVPTATGSNSGATRLARSRYLFWITFVLALACF